tara:strand:- start:6386 stop:6772 length:387 start_codon:yes stop_codon:yes gene_type:complete
MKLIDDFVKRFHDLNLPTPEKCFILEEGDEIFINKWIVKGKINGKAKDLFEWIEKKYLLSKLKLKQIDQSKFDEIQRRFYIKNWRMIILLCDYQAKFRYYSKAINSVKEKSFSDMDIEDFLKLFEKNE